MKRILITIALACLFSGCASSNMVKPLAPDNQITSLFRFNFITKKSVDVIVAAINPQDK